MTLRTRPHLGLRRATRLRAFYQRPPIATPGLLALYEPWRQVLNGQTGQTLFDQHGGTYDATLGSTSGADSNDPAWTGQGLDLDGTDDYVARSIGSRTLGPGEVTLEGWFKLDGTEATRTIFCLGSSTDGTPLALIYLYVTGALACQWRGDDGVGVDVALGVSPSINTWHHLAAAWTSDGTVAVYLDGTLVSTTAAVAGDLTVNLLGVGAAVRYDPVAPFHFYAGQIAQSAPYLRALNAIEIARNYQWYRSRLSTVGINLT